MFSQARQFNQSKKDTATMKFPSDLAKRAIDEVGDAEGLRGLFMEAAETERKMPRAFDLRSKGCWPNYADDPGLSFGYNETLVQSGGASSKEISNYELSLLLTQYFTADQSKLVWAAAHSSARSSRGPRWRAISKLSGTHPATTKRRFSAAILELWYKMWYAC